MSVLCQVNKNINVTVREINQRDGIYRASIICRNLWSQVIKISMVLVFVLIWVKSVLRCLLYIFHLSEINTQGMP